MPTIEKRLFITPSPTVGPLLRELSKVTGKPAATLVREFLDEAAPALQMTLEALKMAKTRPAEAQAAMARLSAQAINQLTQQQLDLDSALRKKPGRKPSGKKKPGRGAAKTG